MRSLIYSLTLWSTLVGFESLLLAQAEDAKPETPATANADDPPPPTFDTPTADTPEGNKQDTPGAEPGDPSEKPAEPPASDPAEKPADADKGADLGLPQSIYIPFKNLITVFEKPGSVIVLPYAEYLELKKRAEAQAAQMPSVAVAITESKYVAVIEKDIARISVELKVNVLGKPWVELPIRFGAAAVGKIEAGDKVLLKGAGDGAYSLLLGEAGEQTIKLELEARVHSSPEGRSFDFECPPVGITTFEIAIPEASQAIDVTPQVVALPVEAGMNETRFKASLGATGRIAAKWYPKASTKPEMDLLTRVTNHSLVAIEDGLIHTDSYLNIEILRGGLEQFTLAAPKGVRVLDVSSNAKLKGWQVKDEENRQVITVDLLAPQEGQLQLEVHTEMKQPDEAFAVAGLADGGAAFGVHALDTTNETGQVVIRNSADLTLSIVEQQGVTRIDLNEAQERIRAAGGSGFKYYNPKFTLRASVKPVEPRLILDHQSVLTFLDDELRLNATLSYVVDKAGVFQILIKTPEKLEIDRVDCGQMKEFNFDAVNRLLTVSLLEKTQGNIVVQVQAHLPYSAGKEMGELVLPLVEPVGTERETGGVQVFARDAIEVVTNEKGLASAQPAPIASGTKQGDASINSAWTFTRRPVTIPVTTSRKPTRLSASVATKLDVQPDMTRVQTFIDFDVEFAGIDTFRFQVPEAASDTIQIQGIATDSASPAVKQKTKGEVENGWVTWTIVMQREVTGRQRFEVTYDLKAGELKANEPEASAPGAATKEEEKAEPATVAVPPAQDAAALNAQPSALSLSTPMIRPLGYEKGEQKTALSQTSGEITILKEESLSVSGQAKGGDVEQIDVRELERLPQTGTLAYRYFDQPADGAIEVTIEQSKFEIQKVVATVISKALVEIVMGEGPEATFRARYRIKTSERQRLLVHLPINLQILGSYINDREVKLEKATVKGQPGTQWESFWLNVVRTGQADEEFLVTFHFQWSVTPALGDSQYGRGGLELPLPVFGAKSDNVPLQQMQVAVYVPKEFRLVGDPAGFVRDVYRQPFWNALFKNEPKQESSQLQSWIGGGAMAALPTDGRVAHVYNNLGGANIMALTWWHHVRMSVMFSLAVALVALVLVRTSWENKLGFLLCGALALALFGLKDNHAMTASLQAMRAGLAFLAALWLLRTVFQCKDLVFGGTAPPVTTPPEIIPVSQIEIPATPENPT